MDLRRQFVQRGTMPTSDLCQAYGISRKTGYKYLARYEAGGLPALADRSRRAHDSPLATTGLVASMSWRGDGWDNAVVESFFVTLKQEPLARHRWPTREAASAAVAEYIESWYKLHWRQSTLGYLSPAAYEARLHSAA